MNRSRLALALVVALAVPALLGGCGQVASFTAGDMNTAAAVANTSNVPATAVSTTAIDPNGYKCWGTMAPVMTAIGDGKSAGLATMIEAARVLIITSKSGGACGMLAGPILAQLALLPGASNIIAQAATTVQ